MTYCTSNVFELAFVVIPQKKATKKNSSSTKCSPFASLIRYARPITGIDQEVYENQSPWSLKDLYQDINNGTQISKSPGIPTPSARSSQPLWVAPLKCIVDLQKSGHFDSASLPKECLTSPNPRGFSVSNCAPTENHATRSQVLSSTGTPYLFKGGDE